MPHICLIAPSIVSVKPIRASAFHCIHGCGYFKSEQSGRFSFAGPTVAHNLPVFVSSAMRGLPTGWNLPVDGDFQNSPTEEARL